MMHKPTQLFQVEFQPVFYFLLFFILGILIEKYCHLPKILILTSMLFSLLVITVNYYLNKYLKITNLLILLGFLLAGVCLADVEYQKAQESLQLVDKYVYSPSIKDTNIELYGEITSYPTFTPSYFYLDLNTSFVGKSDKVASLPAKVKLIIWLDDAKAYPQISLKPRTIVHIFAELNPQEKFKNPGITSSRELLAQQGYDFSVSVKNFRLIEVLEQQPPYFFSNVIYQTRSYVLSKIDQNFNAERSGILKAIILGNGHYLTTDLVEKFRVTGLYHILVISGSHFAFLTWILYKTLKLITKNQISHFIIITSLIWFYALLAGAETPIVRAVLMVTIGLAATLFYRQANPSNTIGITGLVLLAYHPSALFEASFQLTFLAVTLILLIVIPLVHNLRQIGQWYPTRQMPYPPKCHQTVKWLAELLFWSEKLFVKHQTESNIKYKLEKNIWAKRLERWKLQKLLQVLATMFFTASIVQLGLIPLSIIYFNRVVFIGVIFNILAEFLMGYLLVIFSLFILLDNYITYFINDYIVIILNHLIDLFIYTSYPQYFDFIKSKIPFLSYRLAGFHNWQILYYVVYYIFCLGFIIKINNWQPFYKPSKVSYKLILSSKLLIIFYSLLLVFITLPQKFYSNLFNNKTKVLEIVFLDVGQGDAIFIRFPLGTTMMIDSGGKIPIKSKENQAATPFSIGENVDSKYLWQRDIEELDYILLTHPHSDHMQGFDDIIKNFSVHNAILPVNPNLMAEGQNFVDKLINAHIPINIWSKGQSYFIDGVKIEVLWPIKDISKKQAGNNQSLVLMLNYQGRKILLTGDIEKAVEELLTNSNEDLSAEILKAPHHGSKTSSTNGFLQKVNPKVVIISAPAKSMFNHPHKEVIKRYEDLGIKTYQTGLGGAISLYIEPNNLQIEEFIESKAGK